MFMSFNYEIVIKVLIVTIYDRERAKNGRGKREDRGNEEREV